MSISSAGLVHLDENKTDDPRAWALDTGVVDALCRLVRSLPPEAKATAHIFADAAGSRCAARSDVASRASGEAPRATRGQ